jgi:acyl-CoA synthetase (AMP-forming)/AMP-acid ligase II
MKYARWRPGKSTLVALPNFHVAGSVVLLLAMLQGTRGAIVREINPAQLVQVIAGQCVNYAFRTPTGYKVPKSVDLVDALPCNATGKVLRWALRERYWQGQNRRVS